MLISIEHPSILPFLAGFSGGLWPVPRAASERSFLIVKATKEAILSAKIRSGFRIYLVPNRNDESKICGLVTAFFDDSDEPLVIWSPLFGDDDQMNLVFELLSLDEFDVYFFDELNREIIGYSAKNIFFEKVIEYRKNLDALPYSLEAARDSLDYLPKWFGVRTEVEDQAALRIEFIESLYPEDICYFDLTEAPNRAQGQSVPAHTMLERSKPGQLQELDIAKLLRRTFPSDQIFLNPFREDQNTEFVDILIVSDDHILLIQAKDSPNTPEVLGRSILRKKAVVLGQLEKALNQMRGAVKYLKRDPVLRIRIDEITRDFPIGNRQARCLIIVKELFEDSYAAYGEKMVDFIRSSGVPCLVFDYPQLHACTANLNSEEAFMSAYYTVLEVGAQKGIFPRLRFGLGE